MISAHEWPNDTYNIHNKTSATYNKTSNVLQRFDTCKHVLASKRCNIADMFSIFQPRLAHCMSSDNHKNNVPLLCWFASPLNISPFAACASSIPWAIHERTAEVNSKFFNPILPSHTGTAVENDLVLAWGRSKSQALFCNWCVRLKLPSPCRAPIGRQHQSKQAPVSG